MEKFPIGDRGYTATVSAFNGKFEVQVRRFYKEKPTQFGIDFTIQEWNILMRKSKQVNTLIEQMQEVIDRRDECQKQQEELVSE